MASAIPEFAVQRRAARNPAVADPVKRRAIWIKSAMFKNCVRNTQIRNGGDSNPNIELKTRKNNRSLRVRTVPSACGLNST